MYRFQWARVGILMLLGIFAVSGVAALDADEKKDQLRYLIRDVHQAAADGDLAALAELLPPVFKYSFGGDDTREGAIRYFHQRTEKLRILADILATGCRQRSESFYSCPPQDAELSVIYFGPRAGFEFNDDTESWQFRYFVEGD